MPPVGKTIMGGEGATAPLFMNAPSQEVLNAQKEAKEQAMNDELGRLKAEAGKVAGRSQEENRRWTSLTRRSPFTSTWEKQTAEMTTVGLHNPGALCYRNVVLQILAHCPAIYHWCWFYKNHHIPHEEICFKGDNQSTCKMCYLTHFLEHYWDEDVGESLHEKVDELWEIVFTDWAKEMKDGQQDPAELFMEMIHQFADSMPEALRTDWQEICNSEFVTARICRGTKPCERVIYKPSPSNGWPVFSIQFGPNSNAANVQKAFEEHLNDTNDIGQCADCGGEIFEREFFTKPPEVLVLQLNRAGEDGKKIDQRIKFSEKLKIYTDYFDPRCNVASASNIEYELTSIVFHAGETTSSGHYTVMVKGRTGKWTLIDDERATPAAYPDFGPDTKRQQDAYMFVYTRLPRSGVEEKLIRYNNIFGEERLSRKRIRSKSPGPPGSDPVKKPKTMLNWRYFHRHCEEADGEKYGTETDTEDELAESKHPKRRPTPEPESSNNLALQKQLEETQRQLEETQKQLKKMQEQWEQDQAKLRKSQERITATQDRLEQSLNQHAQIITAYDSSKGPDTVSSYSLISADQLDGAFDRALQRWQQQSGSSGDVKASLSAYEKRLDEAIKRIEQIQPANTVSASGSIDSAEIQAAVSRAMQDWYKNNQPVANVTQAPDGAGINYSDVTNVVKQTFEKCLSDQSAAFKADFASKKDIGEEIKRAMKSWQEKDGKEFLKSVQRASTSGSGSGSGSTHATNPPPIDLDGPKMTKDNFKMHPHTGARAFDNKTGFLRIQYFEYHNGNEKNPNRNREYKIPLDFAVRGYPINLKENAMETGLNATLLSLIKQQKSTKKVVTKSAAMRSSTVHVDGVPTDGSGSDDDSSVAEEESDSDSVQST